MTARTKWTFQNEEVSKVGLRLFMGYVSVFVAFAGGIVLLPLSALIFYRNEWQCFPAFLIPGGSALLIGTLFAIVLLRGRQKGKLAKFQDSILLVLIWLVTIIIGALPYFLADKLDFFSANGNVVSMNFSESFYESVSGFSTTGLTLLHGFNADGVPVYTSFLDSELKYCPHVFLFYRALTQFFGGVGLVLVVSSVVSDRFGMQLFNTEGHNDRLLPNLAKTAKMTFGIYIVIILLGAMSMWFFGMNPFEALCHSISAMATGGFSTREKSFYNYSNPNPIFGVVNPIGMEVSICVVMVLGATSFLLLYNALTMKWKNFFKDCEVRLTGLVILVASLLGMFFLVRQYNDGVQQGLDYPTALRYSAFQIISCFTTTGFANVPSVLACGEGVIFLSISTMFIGGGSGSTAGAIKQFRAALLMKTLWWSIRYKFTPSRLVYPHTISRAGKDIEVTPVVFRENILYVILYFLVTCFFMTIFLFLPKGGGGYSIVESLYLVSTSLSSAGNTIVDFLGPNGVYYALMGEGSVWAYNTAVWLLSICMFLGRLEILPLYYAFLRIGRVVSRADSR